jgi:hypothetical protein
LVPYLYSEGTKLAIGRNGSVMQRCTAFETFQSLSYFLGPNIYVVPVQRDASSGQTQRLWLPRSSTKQWINFFDTSITHPENRFFSEDTSTLDRIPAYVEQNSLIPMYDLEKSPSLNAYRFVLWGKVILDQQTTTLFTRDGQQWLIKFTGLENKLSVHFVDQYESTQREEWVWKFCQYADGREICSEEWMRLYDNASVQLDLLN